jgi:hypothetical protein
MLRAGQGPVVELGDPQLLCRAMQSVEHCIVQQIFFRLVGILARSSPCGNERAQKIFREMFFVRPARTFSSSAQNCHCHALGAMRPHYAFTACACGDFARRHLRDVSYKTERQQCFPAAVAAKTRAREQKLETTRRLENDPRHPGVCALSKEPGQYDFSRNQQLCFGNRALRMQPGFPRMTNFVRSEGFPRLIPNGCFPLSRQVARIR